MIWVVIGTIWDYVKKDVDKSEWMNIGSLAKDVAMASFSYYGAGLYTENFHELAAIVYTDLALYPLLTCTMSNASWD